MPKKPKPQPCACGCGEMTAGYWNIKAKRYAQYKQGHHPKHNPPLRRVNDQELLDDIHRIEKELGRAFTWIDLVEHSKFGASTYHLHFGSYHDVLKALGRNLCISWDISSLSPSDGNWLAGIVDGEGSFRINSITGRPTGDAYYPIFYLALRDDDIDAVRLIRDILCIDRKIRINTRPNKKLGSRAKPQAYLSIHNIEDLFHKVVPIFETYPLRTKKSDDFAIFAHLVRMRHEKRLLLKNTHTHFSDQEIDLMNRLYQAAGKIKKYQMFLNDVIEQFNLPKELAY